MTPPKIKKLTPLEAAKEEYNSLVVSFNALKNHMDKAVDKLNDMTTKYNKKSDDYDKLIRRLDETLGDKHKLNQQVDQLTEEINELRNRKIVPTVRFEDNKIIISYEN